jgi:hypothetical protein
MRSLIGGSVVPLAQERYGDDGRSRNRVKRPLIFVPCESRSKAAEKAVWTGSEVRA